AAFVPLDLGGRTDRFSTQSTQSAISSESQGLRNDGFDYPNLCDGRWMERARQIRERLAAGARWENRYGAQAGLVRRLGDEGNENGPFYSADPRRGKNR